MQSHPRPLTFQGLPSNWNNKCPLSVGSDETLKLPPRNGMDIVCAGASSSEQPPSDEGGGVDRIAHQDQGAERGF